MLSVNEISAYDDIRFSFGFTLKAFTSSSSNAKLSLVTSTVTSFTASPRDLWESLNVTNKAMAIAMATKAPRHTIITTITGKFLLSSIASEGSEKSRKLTLIKN